MKALLIGSGPLARFGDCRYYCISAPTDLLFSFASTSTQNNVCMHTDVAAPTPVSWVLMTPRYRQQRTLPVNATPETRPAARLAPKGAVSSKSGATMPSPLFRIQYASAPALQHGFASSQSPYRPNALLDSHYILMYHLLVSMMHMHVLPMAVIIVQTSNTCLTPAQQMHMMQNRNRGAFTASVLLFCLKC